MINSFSPTASPYVDFKESSFCFFQTRTLNNDSNNPATNGGEVFPKYSIKYPPTVGETILNNKFTESKQKNLPRLSKESLSPKATPRVSDFTTFVNELAKQVLATEFPRIRGINARAKAAVVFENTIPNKEALNITF